MKKILAFYKVDGPLPKQLVLIHQAHKMPQAHSLQKVLKVLKVLKHKVHKPLNHKHKHKVKHKPLNQHKQRQQVVQRTVIKLHNVSSQN